MATTAEGLIVKKAMSERSLKASAVESDRVDPASVDARWCLEQYYAELDERFSPASSSSAT